MKLLPICRVITPNVPIKAMLLIGLIAFGVRAGDGIFQENPSDKTTPENATAPDHTAVPTPPQAPPAPEPARSSAIVSAEREYDDTVRSAEQAHQQAQLAADRVLVEKLKAILSTAGKTVSQNQKDAILTQINAAESRIAALSGKSQIVGDNVVSFAQILDVLPDDLIPKTNTPADAQLAAANSVLQKNVVGRSATLRFTETSADKFWTGYAYLSTLTPNGAFSSRVWCCVSEEGMAAELPRLLELKPGCVATSAGKIAKAKFERQKDGIVLQVDLMFAKLLAVEPPGNAARAFVPPDSPMKHLPGKAGEPTDGADFQWIVGSQWHWTQDQATILTFREDHSVACHYWTGNWHELNAHSVRINRGKDEVTFTIADSRRTAVEEGTTGTPHLWVRDLDDKAAIAAPTEHATDKPTVNGPVGR